jgi:hypothetical protein
MKNKSVVCLVILFVATGLTQAAISNFENITLASESFWNGSDGSGGFTSGDAYFVNNYNTTYNSWDGFACSNTTDTTTSGYLNQYSAITGGGVDGSANYGVSYHWSASTVTLAQSSDVTGAYFTNTTYAYLAMLNGEGPASAFSQDDWFKLTVTGKDAQGTTTNSVDFLLADGTAVVDDWTWVDLTGLGTVASLEFSLTSTDNGDWGMNTPAYFAMDDLTTVVPEPAAMALLGFGTLLMRRKKG